MQTLTANTTLASEVEGGEVVDCDKPGSRSGATAASAGENCCFHCGTPVRVITFTRREKLFCCQGCLTVFELLAENGLAAFYQLGPAAGVRIKRQSPETEFRYLDEPAVRQRLVDFANEEITRVTFRVPAIHCIACVWLLENLFRLKPGIGHSRVNFLEKEVTVTFSNKVLALSQVAALLASLGYEPDLKFSDLDRQPRSAARRLWLQLGVAGFAFGNIMLFSISSYSGLDSFSGPVLKRMFGAISLALALPVIFFSAADYWRSAWLSLRQKLLTIDVPIAAGIAALAAQSTYEVVSGRGEGYFDSLAGLVFFLLCGKLFQQKTYERLTFDRDYKSFFPLSVMRKRGASEESVSLAQLQTGDELVIRNGELIPADSRLVAGPALIDYSFVTGEAEPVEKKADDYLYAGGRQIGGAIRVETLKPVSQGYLTSLWNQDAFRKNESAALGTLINIYSQRFTKIVIAIALGAALFWWIRNPSLSMKAFTSVLIVACPCALALAAPFTLGTAQRILGRNNVFLKNTRVIETLAKVNSVVFDKTGTLTAAGAVTWHGKPLSETEEGWFYSMTRHSTHPLAVRLGQAIAREHSAETVRSFLETTGCGMEGNVARHEIWMGAAAWLASRNVRVLGSERSAAVSAAAAGNSKTVERSDMGGEAKAPRLGTAAFQGSAVHVAIDGEYRGRYTLASALRPATDTLIARLSKDYDLSLLSGDNEREREGFSKLFGDDARLHFNQGPLNKLEFIRELQQPGKTVMMVGDGLNDAGALRQSDVGVAVVERISAFSPASDVILSAGMVSRLPAVLRFSRLSVRVVRISFLISSIYNVAGLSIAASGRLSPVVCAILMPLSSVTVVAFACGATNWLSRRAGLGKIAAPDFKEVAA